MEQLELNMAEGSMMQTAALQEAMAEALVSALDGAFANGCPVNLASISFEGLDGDGTVTVNAVGVDGTKFSADVEVMPAPESPDAAAEEAPAGEAAGGDAEVVQ